MLPALIVGCCIHPPQVRGVTIEGNVNGTTQRTGKHRRYKRQGGSGNIGAGSS
jgi:hypothetical protein